VLNYRTHIHTNDCGSADFCAGNKLYLQANTARLCETSGGSKREHGIKQFV
jgi:hypothetical protein